VRTITAGDRSKVREDVRSLRRPNPPERERPGDHTAAVTCVARTDIPAVAALAADHIQYHPAAEWLVPDPGERRKVLCAWFTILVEYALANGQIDILTDRTAAAIWLDRTRPLPKTTDYRRRLRKVCGEHVDAVMLLTEVLDNHRPAVEHLHLAVLVADQAGAAEALLAHRHLRLDRTAVAGYALDGTQKHLGVLMDAGYQPAEEIRLPAGPALWPTWRPAADVPTTACAQAATQTHGAALQARPDQQPQETTRWASSAGSTTPATYAANNQSCTRSPTS
jgi:hypothetical protein